jgi:hypothetical protein
MSEEYSNDSVTEVTTTGWLQRIVQSFVGAVIGVLLVIGSIVLLWWNEGRAVAAIRALDRGRGSSSRRMQRRSIPPTTASSCTSPAR